MNFNNLCNSGNILIVTLLFHIGDDNELLKAVLVGDGVQKRSLQTISTTFVNGRHWFDASF